MTDWLPGRIPSDLQGRRILDKAEGILIGLRRCSSQAAFEELLGAAQRHGIPVFNLAWALVHLASDRHKPPQHLHSAHSAAHREWAGLLTVPAASTT
jgi:ANTAR domain